MRKNSVCAGRGVGDASWLGDGGGVVVKWFDAGVGITGDREAPTDDGVGVKSEEGSAERAVDIDAPHLLTIKAAVGTEDRKGDVIDPDGWELSGYRRNPVFLWAHDRSIPPIGQAKRLWFDDGALHAVVEFAPTDFAREVAGLYVRGFMRGRGVSVGFLPLEVEMREGSGGRRGYHYRRQELLEISAVPVPMHTDALAMRSQAPIPRNGEANEMRRDVRELWRAVVALTA